MSFNNRVQRRKVSDSSAESNTNKFVGSPDDVPSTRTETGLNVSRSAFSMASTSSEQTPTGPPKLSHRPQPSSSQEVNPILKILYVIDLNIKDTVILINLHRLQSMMVIQIWVCI